ncbi:MAG: GNAT family N-acetyltransferase [Alphaproteobacteria bacterium]|nr:GNAT family N-acetyltransferase [Alphaproteobacteria bacterium]
MQVLIYSAYHNGHKALYRDLYEMTKSIEENYPRYRDWYYHTFLEDLKRGNRAYAVAVHRADLAGCCLMKDTPKEKKICTLFVPPKYQRQGVGTDLVRAAVRKLGTAFSLTVPLTKLPSFSPFLTRLGFQMDMIPFQNDNTPKEALFTRSSPQPIQRAHILLPVDNNKSRLIS